MMPQFEAGWRARCPPYEELVVDAFALAARRETRHWGFLTKSGPCYIMRAVPSRPPPVNLVSQRELRNA